MPTRGMCGLVTLLTALCLGPPASAEPYEGSPPANQAALDASNGEDRGSLWPPFVGDPIRIQMHRDTAQRGTLRWLLDGLTGVEISWSAGSASVKSTIRNEFGAKIPVAFGYTDFGGFGIGLLTAPRHTSFGIRPDAGFFTKRATVNGFEQGIPSEPNTFDVRGVCTDAETGEPAGCTEVDRYDLNLWSIHGGPQIFGAFVMANSWLELFAVGTGTLRVAELRSTGIQIGSEAHRNKRFTFFRSLTGGGAIGASFPRQHLSFRVSVDYEHFFRFRYAVPLEFDGPVSYDAETDIYIRPRLQLEDASIEAVTAKLSAGVLF